MIFIKSNQLAQIKLKQRADLYLCMKTITVNTQKYLKKMKRFNRGIKLAGYSKIVFTLFPQLAVLGASSSESIKRLLQGLQNAYHISYLNKMRKQFSKRCPFNPSLIISPYSTIGLVLLKRDKIGAAKLRKKKWRTYIRKHLLILVANFQIKKKLRIQVKELSIPEDMQSSKELVGYLF